MTTQQGIHDVPVPLAVRMRPRSLDEVVGQQHLKRRGTPLWLLTQPDADQRRLPNSVILWGPPGTGKTTLAQVIARSSGRSFIELSAITAGVKDVRQVMEHAQTQRDLYGQSTVLFLDEIHRFSKAQQDALLPGVEAGTVVLVAATTENPSFSVISPLLSRSLMLTLHTISEDDLRTMLQRAVDDERGLAGRFTVTDGAMSALVQLANGDGRRALTALEAAAGIAEARAEQTEQADGAPIQITAAQVSDAVDRALLRYDRAGDEHYDVISAFIKSVRGSDVDAALHYLARMIESGEDARFIARRIVILAAEDIGMADPQALPIAVAAAQAVQLIGLPEGRIVLGEAVTYLACAPKSNASYRATDEAIADVRAGKFGPVPPHLRDAHYSGAKRLGHGVGYRYPHDASIGIVQQQYLPDELVGAEYYRPSGHGYEAEVRARLERLRQILHPDSGRS